jgi:hypothetical protein
MIVDGPEHQSVSQSFGRSVDQWVRKAGRQACTLFRKRCCSQAAQIEVCGRNEKTLRLPSRSNVPVVTFEWMYAPYFLAHENTFSTFCVEENMGAKGGNDFSLGKELWIGHSIPRVIRPTKADAGRLSFSGYLIGAAALFRIHDWIVPDRIKVLNQLTTSCLIRPNQSAKNQHAHGHQIYDGKRVGTE